MGSTLLGFDIPGLQRYVFAPVRPVDVMGGSRLLERFSERAAQIAADAGFEPVYSGGGTGLFVGPDNGGSGGDPVRANWGAELERLTAGGVQLVVAAVPFEGELPAARRRLASALEEERARLALDRASPTLLPEGTWPSSICQACGIEPAHVEDRVGDQREGIGRWCEARRREGRRAGTMVLRRLFADEVEPLAGGETTPDPDRPPPGAILATIYLDADGLGRAMAVMPSLDDLRSTSATVRRRTATAVATANQRAAASGRAILAPIVGGDDVLIFCDAALAQAILPMLVGQLTASADDAPPLRFSGSIVFADPYTPLRHIFAVARSALKEAKLHAHRADAPHLSVRSLLAGRLHPGATDVFGGPIPMELVAGADRPSPIDRLTGAILEVSDRSQRLGLSRDLLEAETEEERLLYIEDRLARMRDGGLRAALGEARWWSDRLPGRRISDILLGGLVLVDLMEGQGQ